ncbi:hypothetical protein HHK36_029845 [Tetracentron sinense]|uniref:Strictosidine synthase conserved region domain-containing protein n=1 Tax=Tetracentron sinense TaxID=13715 RepID=A0A834YA92_TETSI|nr:hypothetical protein HHK36_029845 [Tetracentron sinense]
MSSIMKLSLFSILFLSFISLSYHSEAYDRLRNYQRLQLTNAVGPESFAFDCNGEGPYTGVSDGRILKWDGANRGWKVFAVTLQHRREVCDGSNDPSKEHICGRPLGLKFNKKTCDLYIADAYFGLLVVGRNGGVANQLATSAGGVPFRFTNALDIDEKTGVVYFTDSSIWYQRWEFLMAIITGDKTGRLMKYDPCSKEVTVLQNGIAFANGVALSKDNSFVLVAETTTLRILRFWLQGPKAQTSEVFAQLPGNPDNIKRNANGEFWVALNSGGGKLQNSTLSNLKAEGTIWTLESQSLLDDVAALKLDENGKFLEVLKSNNGGRTLESISEVEENDGILWIGSVVMPYAVAYKV